MQVWFIICAFFMQQNDGKSVNFNKSVLFLQKNLRVWEKSSTFVAHFVKMPFGTPKNFANFTYKSQSKRTRNSLGFLAAPGVFGVFGLWLLVITAFLVFYRESIDGCMKNTIPRLYFGCLRGSAGLKHIHLYLSSLSGNPHSPLPEANNRSAAARG